MYRVHLTANESAELERRCRDKGTLPRTRDRLEMVRLANTGWSCPRIARHFGRTESRVRHWLKAFLAGGFDALESKKSPGPPRKMTETVLAELKAVVGQDGRTWTCPQIQEWLQSQHNISINRFHLSEVLVRHGMSYKRTTRTVRHKQTPEQVAQKKADLETLKKGQSPE